MAGAWRLEGVVRKKKELTKSSLIAKDFWQLSGLSGSSTLARFALRNCKRFSGFAF